MTFPIPVKAIPNRSSAPLTSGITIVPISTNAVAICVSPGITAPPRFSANASVITPTAAISILYFLTFSSSSGVIISPIDTASSDALFLTSSLSLSSLNASSAVRPNTDKA